LGTSVYRGPKAQGGEFVKAQNPGVVDDACAQRLGVQRAYALWAETYDAATNPMLALEERILAPMLPSLGGKLILDLGCGTGRWLARTRLRARSYVGLDVSKPMLDRASAKPGLAGHLVQADCVRMPLKSGVADVVVGSFLLGYVDAESLSFELQRISHEGTDLFFSEFHEGAVTRGWNRSFRHDGQLVELPVVSRSSRQWSDVFRQNGFDLYEDVEAGFGEEERASFSKAGKEHYFEQVRGVKAIFVCHFKRVRRIG
jgi:malonyl-CoA O-methyltransferase